MPPSDPSPSPTPTSSLSSPSGPSRVFTRYVALGDSSTEGLDDPDGHGGYIGWSQRLANRIHSSTTPGLLYANLAVRGLVTAEIRATQIAPALALRPDLATVFCGTNDVTAPRFDAARVAADIAHMQRALVSSGATVVSFTLPDLTPLMPLARLIAPRIAALNRALSDASRATGAILVDFASHPVATDRRLWSDDRIHANSAGHARIADALAHALQLPGTNDAWSRAFPRAPRRHPPRPPPRRGPLVRPPSSPVARPKPPRPLRLPRPLRQTPRPHPAPRPAVATAAPPTSADASARPRQRPRPCTRDLRRHLRRVL